MKKKNVFKNTAAAIVSWGAIIYLALIVCRAQWHFVDFLYPVLFNPFLAGIFITFYIAGFNAALSIIWFLLNITVGRIKLKTARAAMSAYTRFLGFNRHILAFILTVYGIASIAGFIAMDNILGPTALFSFALAGSAVKSLQKRNRIIPIQLAVAIVIFAAPICFAGIVTKNPTFRQHFVFIPFVAAACFWRPLFPSFRWMSARQFIYVNRHAFIVFGLILAFLVMFGWVFWWPYAGNAQAQFKIKQNTSTGAVAAIAFAKDGKHLLALNKTAYSVQLIDRDSLNITSSISTKSYPRQMAIDKEKRLFYVVVHTIKKRQFRAFSESPFKLVKTIDFPAVECDQANSINIDYKRDQIIVGCDDRSALYFIDRQTLELIRRDPPPSIKGFTVRIEVDERNDKAFVFGCLNGPFINVVDLASGNTITSKFTGYMVWETVFDAENNRFFLSLPFRSMVAVVSEKSLQTVRTIPAGFGARTILIDKKNNRLFIGSQISNTVAVHDLRTFKRLAKFYIPGPRSLLYDDDEEALYVAGEGVYKLKIPHKWPR
ncbi:MAG: hypothetical protein WCX65_11265 [bacterium]